MAIFAQSSAMRDHVEALVRSLVSCVSDVHFCSIFCAHSSPTNFIYLNTFTHATFCTMQWQEIIDLFRSDPLYAKPVAEFDGFLRNLEGILALKVGRLDSATKALPKSFRGTPDEQYAIKLVLGFLTISTRRFLEAAPNTVYDNSIAVQRPDAKEVSRFLDFCSEVEHFYQVSQSRMFMFIDVIRSSLLVWQTPHLEPRGEKSASLCCRSFSAPHVVCLSVCLSVCLPIVNE